MEPEPAKEIPKKKNSLPTNPKLRELMLKKKKMLPNDVFTQIRDDILENIDGDEAELVEKIAGLPTDKTLPITILSSNELMQNVLLLAFQNGRKQILTQVVKSSEGLDTIVREYIKTNEK